MRHAPFSTDASDRRRVSKSLPAIADVSLACRLTSVVRPYRDHRSCPACRGEMTRPPQDDLRVPSTELEDTGGGRGVQYGVDRGRSRARAGRLPGSGGPAARLLSPGVALLVPP